MAKGQKRIFLLLGGSGSGKSTLGAYLKELGIAEMVSHTTRPAREGEVEGVSYYFIDKSTFDKLDRIEETQYPKDTGYFYCLSASEVTSKLSTQDTVFAITDRNGVEQIKKRYPNETRVIFVYITLEEMKKRMLLRGDAPEKVNIRLENAKETGELENYDIADYVIENIDLEASKAKIKAIVEAKPQTNIERRFLIQAGLDFHHFPHRQYQEGYLVTKPEMVLSAELDENGNEMGVYSFLSRQDGVMTDHKVLRKFLNKEQFDEATHIGSYWWTKKTRYYRLDQGFLLVIDHYVGKRHRESLDIASVIFTSKEESRTFIPPSYFEEEITANRTVKREWLRKNHQ